MTDQQQFIIKNKSFPTVLVVIILILIGVILYMSKCNSVSHPNGYAEKLQKRITEDSLKAIDQKRLYEDSERELRGRIILQSVINQEKDRNLKILENKVDKLLADHTSEPPPVLLDSGQYMVSEKWVKECANCFSLLEQGKDSVRSLLHERDELDNLYKEDTTLKSHRIDTLERNLTHANDKYGNLLAKYVIDTKPKPHFYIGAKASGSALTPFNQVGGILNFLDKKGRMFTGGGGIQRPGEWYIEGGILIKIF